MDKARTIFDFIKDMTVLKTNWEDISDSDKKNYSVFMTNRILSMDMNLIGIVDEYQHVLNDKKIHYEFYKSILPKKTLYLKYISKKVDKTVPDYSKLVELIAKHLQCSTVEASDNLDFVFDTDIGASITLKNFTQLYGYNEKEISKLFKL